MNRLIRRALYPGSFDPLTNGHLDIIERTLSVFHEVRVLVAASSRKNSMLSMEERVELIKKAFKGNRRVTVDCWEGLIMDYARNHKMHAVVRGLRAASDFEYEFMMAAMNRNLNSDVETFFMMTGQNMFFISSTMVKELFRFGGDIAPYVPKPVLQRLMQKRKEGEL